MDFPKLQDNQHAVVTAEVHTGIILRFDGQRRQGNVGQAWRVFDSLAQAREFALAEVAANTEVECGIYSAHQHHIETLVNEKYGNSRRSSSGEG